MDLTQSTPPPRLGSFEPIGAIGRPRPSNPKNFLQTPTGPWEIIIGIEVHAQIMAQSKLFSGASTAFGGEPNSHVSLVDAGMPGMLPVINGYCIQQAVRTGLGLKAEIHRTSIFDRKNYFYPDLPQGYQISQYHYPIVGKGEIWLHLPETEAPIYIGIERIHLEQDAGKSLHDQHPSATCVDLNRCGIALMEIVSQPDLRSSEEARAYVTKLRNILRYLGTCDGDMEKGNLRADVNVSVRRPEEKFGTRCEIKNVNSIRFIGQAIEAEARRQIGLLEEGQEIQQETRLFDPTTGRTRALRSKENAQDYRYFPDPDLLPLHLSEEFIEDIAAHLPELPDTRLERFRQDYGLSLYDANVLISEKAVADYYESVVRQTIEGAPKEEKAAAKRTSQVYGKLAANWVINELFGRLNKASLDIQHAPIAPSLLAKMLLLLSTNRISSRIAKDLFEILWNEGGEPEDIVQQRGWETLSDMGAVEAALNKIIAEHPEKVIQIQTKPNLLGWFVGQVMKETSGKASPQAVHDLVKSKLLS